MIQAPVRPFILADRLHRPQPGDPPRLGHLLVAFHERHLPLTLDLARHLVRFELAPSPARDPFWGRAYGRCNEALKLGESLGGSGVWRYATPDFLLHVVEPLLRAAARATGLVPIYGLAELGEDPPADATHQIEVAVEAMLTTTGWLGPSFWQRTGVALHAAMRRSGAARSGLQRAAALPFEAELDTICLTLGLEPTFDPKDAETFRRVRPKERAMRRRAGIRPKEGGVVGIRPSRMLDDLPDALTSEMLLPEIMVANRLQSEGILVRHRPPMREPRRDLLALTLADRRMLPEAGALAKAAWCDAMVRARILLARLGRPLSDLGWAEADRHGLRAVGLSVATAEPVRTGLDVLSIAGELRALMLLRSGLMPDVFDLNLARPPPGPPAFEDPASGSGAPIPAMARAAMTALSQPAIHRAPSPGATQMRQDAVRLRPSDYGRRAALVVAPAGSALATHAEADLPSARSKIDSELVRALHSPPFSVSVLIMPDRLKRGAELRFIPSADSKAQDIAIPDEGDGEQALGLVLGRLSALFIHWLLESADA